MVKEHFGDVLTEYIEERQRSSGQLAGLSGIPKHTIVSWREGRVKRPRSVIDILKVAQALNLTNDEVNRLLASASKESVDALLVEADDSGTDDSAADDLNAVLQTWAPSPQTHTSQIPAPVSTPQFIPMTAPRSSINFVPREELMDDLQKSLEGGNVCALWGMGGIGKTEVAKRLAHRMVEHYPDGILWAELNSPGSERLTDNQRISAILGNWLELCGWQVGNDGGEFESIASRSRVLRTIMSERKMLMVLDDVTDAKEVEWFLPPPSSESALLITTRNSRTVRAHSELFEVNRFTIDKSLELIQEFIGKERLCIEEESIRQLVGLLDGHPLALAVVGSDLEETRSVTVREYYELLEDERLRLAHLSDWEDGSRNVRATFELSYRRMDAESQEMLMTLALFSDNEFSADAVAASAAKPLILVKRVLGRLCSLALLEEISSSSPAGSGTEDIQNSDNTSRYRLHRLVRAFAIEKQNESAIDWRESRLRLARYMAEFANAHSSQPFRKLEQERENIFGTLRWLAAEEEWHLYGDVLGGLSKIGLGLAGYLDSSGYWSTAIQLLEQLEESSQLVDQPLDLAEVQIKLSYFYQRTGKHDQALGALQSAEQHLDKLSQTPAQQMLLAFSYELRSRLYEKTDRSAARDEIEKALTLVRNVSTDMANDMANDMAKREKGYLLIRHGSIVGQLGELDNALKLSLQGLQLLPDTPTSAVASGLANVGIIHDMQGRSNEAIDAWLDAMNAAEAIGALRLRGNLWTNVGVAEYRRGRLFDAIEATDRALDCFEPFDFVEGRTLLYCNLGVYYGQLRDFEASSGYLKDAEALSREFHLMDLLLRTLVNQVQLNLDKHEELEPVVNIRSEVDVLQKRLQDTQHQLELQRLDVELLLRKGNLVEAKEQIDILLTHTVANPLEEGLILRLYGDVLTKLETNAQAETAYIQSAEIFSPINKYEYARSLLRLGTYYQYVDEVTGQPLSDACRDAFARAYQTFRELNYTSYFDLIPYK